MTQWSVRPCNCREGKLTLNYSTRSTSNKKNISKRMATSVAFWADAPSFDWSKVCFIVEKVNFLVMVGGSVNCCVPGCTNYYSKKRNVSYLSPQKPGWMTSGGSVLSQPSVTLTKISSQVSTVFAGRILKTKICPSMVCDQFMHYIEI